MREFTEKEKKFLIELRKRQGQHPDYYADKLDLTEEEIHKITKELNQIKLGKAPLVSRKSFRKRSGGQGWSFYLNKRFNQRLQTGRKVKVKLKDWLAEKNFLPNSIKCEIIEETDKAIKIFYEGRYEWLPLSQITIINL